MRNARHWGALLVLLGGVVHAAPKPPAIEFDATEVRIHAGNLHRTLKFDQGNPRTTSLRVDRQELLAGPAPELSLTISQAEPNLPPAGIKPGTGGVIDSVKTFWPGPHIDPSQFDDAALRPSPRWVAPIHLVSRDWADRMEMALAGVTVSSTNTQRFQVTTKGKPGSGLEGLFINLCYELFPDEPVIRKWVSITNQSQRWLKLDHLKFEDVDLTPKLGQRIPLTPAGYGVEPSLIGFAASNNAFGIIAGSEIPSGLRLIETNGAQGYHPERFEWCLGPGEAFTSEPVFLYAFSGSVNRTISAVSTPLDRAVEDPFQRFLTTHVGVTGARFPCDAPQWLTWATFGPNLDDALIRQLAELAGKAGFVQFLIDDGWQRDRLGTEPDQSKFPNFKATATYIRSQGLKLGLWLSCFRDTQSPDYRAFPEALSRPTVTRLGGLAMSFTTPWREFYAQDLARLHANFGVAYFKQDFSNLIYGDLAEGHPSRTRKESVLRGLRGLLETQDDLLELAPNLMNELTHEIYWDTPGAPCDIAALKHVARYHVSPNACRGIAPRPKTGSTTPAPPDPQKLQEELRAGCDQARQIFYAHRGLPLYCLEFYGAATESHASSLTPEIQDRQVASWLLGAPLVFSGDLRTLSAEQLEHYRQRFAEVKRLQNTWDIYHYFQFSGVPTPTDEDWHWWGKLNDDGHGAVVVVRGKGGKDQRAINIPWVKTGQRYRVTAVFSGKKLGTFSSRQLQGGSLKLSLPAYGQEILELQ